MERRADDNDIRVEGVEGNLNGVKTLAEDNKSRLDQLTDAVNEKCG